MISFRYFSQCGRGSAGLHDQVRLLLGRHQPDRRHQQDGSQGEEPVWWAPVTLSSFQSFLALARRRFNLTALDSILAAPPTAELEPLVEGRIAQTDEEDMGMSYDELAQYGRLRKPGNCGPYSMFMKLVHRWGQQRQLTPTEVANKVKLFFR